MRLPARIARVLLLAIVPAGLLAGAAPADAAGSLAPFVDCITQDPGSGLVTAYFGYANTTGNYVYIQVGPGNTVSPTDPYQGQPTYFSQGSYPRVFRVIYDPALYDGVTWSLNGTDVVATASSPVCARGVTTPASGVTATSATLNGVVLPGGQDTTYQFVLSAPGAHRRLLALTDAGSGTAPVPVQAALTGLTPAATYTYHLQTTNSLGTFDAPAQSFTTAAAPVPELAITTKSLPAGKKGKTYTATVAAAGGTTPYQWLLRSGHLPAGLHLAPATGVISGRLASTATTATFTITVIDSASPDQRARSATLTIKVG